MPAEDTFESFLGPLKQLLERSVLGPTGLVPPLVLLCGAPSCDRTMQRAESGLRVYLYNKVQVHHRGVIAFGVLALLCLPGLVEIGNSEGVKLGLRHYEHWCSTR